MRFIHTADWQIGKPYRQIAHEQKCFKLQQERLNAIGRIRDAAHIEDAAFVVVAGDLFDSPTPPTTAVLEVLEAIGEMEIPVLVIPGNHDHSFGTRDYGLDEEAQAGSNNLIELAALPWTEVDYVALGDS
jgi:DNA repair exonuclease SbcCD nuclease subunit